MELETLMNIGSLFRNADDDTMEQLARLVIDGEEIDQDATTRRQMATFLRTVEHFLHRGESVGVEDKVLHGSIQSLTAAIENTK